MLPSFEHNKVQALLSQTEEAENLNLRKGNPPISQIADISLMLKKLESGLSLSAGNLLEIAYVLRLSRELKTYFYGDEDFDLSAFPKLEDYFSLLYNNISIENKIFSSILDTETIADDASSKLKSLRRTRKNLEASIKDTLNHMIHSATYAKCIMEPIITIRNDRYVIPVKEEYRSNIKGFVHDVSSKGSTIFIEPMNVFELNSKIAEIKVEELVEIERILLDLSSLLFPIVSELATNVKTISILDFIFAKASYSRNINGILPTLTLNKDFTFKSARHPLIAKDIVVPIDIAIGQNYTSLIITGPNTGGKTVSLKTCGLFCLMAYSGIFIPCKEASLYVFDHIFADIGDEQSIEESLSTFSAHMTNIVNIVDSATPKSLILLDELGSGTDPVEGANLAISILEHFHNIGALTLATTHYPEIKNYALMTDGFENASSEFDLENLKPTYRLLIGVPGKSNAFAISQKLGLSASILERANCLMNGDEIHIEELLKEIYDNKLTIEKEKEEISKNLNQVELLRKSLEKEKSSSDGKEKELQEKAKQDALKIFLNAKEEVNTTIREIDEIAASFKALDEAPLEELSDSEIAFLVKNHYSKESKKRVNILRNKLNVSLSSVSKKEDVVDAKSTFSKQDLKVGMQVIVRNLDGIVTITSLSGKPTQAMGMINNIKMSIKVNDIVQIISSSKPAPIGSAISSNYFSKAKQIPLELNVIGLAVDEAIPFVDKYLDDCYLAKVSPVRIVHGKGTGKLREGIHSFLKKDKRVSSFRLGTFGEGEMGVSVVELK